MYKQGYKKIGTKFTTKFWYLQSESGLNKLIFTIKTESSR